MTVVATLTLIAVTVLSASRVYAALDPTDTATGTGALTSENGGSFNTADGHDALTANTTGVINTAVGAGALSSNTTGSSNTAVGGGALSSNNPSSTISGSGGANTAVGVEALVNNTTGQGNVAVGDGALDGNFTGSDNTALGTSAGETGNVHNANFTGSDNTFLGYRSGPGTFTQLNNATTVGANALVNESNALVLGASSVSVGVGTSSPRSLLQVGTPGTSYGSYFQVPLVTSSTAPPDSDCNTSTFVGRMVLQYDPAKVRTTLWTCSPAGTWTLLARG